MLQVTGLSGRDMRKWQAGCGERKRKAGWSKRAQGAVFISTGDGRWRCCFHQQVAEVHLDVLTGGAAVTLSIEYTRGQRGVGVLRRAGVRVVGACCAIENGEKRRQLELKAAEKDRVWHISGAYQYLSPISNLTYIEFMLISVGLF